MTVRTAARSVLVIAGTIGLLAFTAAERPSDQGDVARKPRLNRIIEQLEQGKPAFGGEHWRLIEMEHGPYDIKEVVKIFGDLWPKDAERPKLTPVVRIPLEGDEVVKSMVKQLLDQ